MLIEDTHLNHQYQHGLHQQVFESEMAYLPKSLSEESPSTLDKKNALSLHRIKKSIQLIEQSQSHYQSRQDSRHDDNLAQNYDKKVQLLADYHSSLMNAIPNTHEQKKGLPYYS